MKYYIYKKLFSKFKKEIYGNILKELISLTQKLNSNYVFVKN